MWSHIPLSSLPRSPRSRSLATCFSSRAPRLLVFSFERSGAAIPSTSPLVINFRSVQQDFKNFFVAIYAATVILVGASNATAVLPRI